MLRIWRTARSGNQTEAAYELDLQVSQISRFETGGAKPGRQLALRLRKRCGIHISAWDEDPEETQQEASESAQKLTREGTPEPDEAAS